jgi:hypothetical protein
LRPPLTQVLLEQLNKNEGQAVERYVLRATELRRPIQSDEKAAALEQLEKSGDIEADARRIWRAEPDLREIQLEKPVRACLLGAECCSSLRIDPASMVSTTRPAAVTGIRECSPDPISRWPPRVSSRTIP